MNSAKIKVAFYHTAFGGNSILSEDVEMRDAIGSGGAVDEKLGRF